MSCLVAINKIIRFECECPRCLNKIKSDDILSPIYGIDYDEVVEIYQGDEWEIECPECDYKFKIDEVDWDG